MWDLFLLVGDVGKLTVLTDEPPIVEGIFCPVIINTVKRFYIVPFIIAVIYEIGPSIFIRWRSHPLNAPSSHIVAVCYKGHTLEEGGAAGNERCSAAGPNMARRFVCRKQFQQVADRHS
jgi:hypothetical protein